VSRRTSHPEGSLAHDPEWLALLPRNASFIITIAERE
jgi:hypothetical protein